MRTLAALGAVIAAFAVTAPADASLIGWGMNGHGELGTGSKGPPQGPVQAEPSLTGAVQVVSTYFTSYALMPDGTVWAWGGNVWGQLGDGDRVTQLTPVAVHGLTGVKEIAAGGAHAIALLSNGRVATWGADGWGTLGNGTTAHGRPGTGVQPGLVPLLLPIQGAVAVAASGADDAVLLGNGTVLAWGENRDGQLGDGTTEEKDVPTPVAGLTGVRAIALGGESSLGGHLLALRSDGTVWAAGGNARGQLGDGTMIDRSVAVKVATISGVTAISTSADHSLALLSDGSVWAWGGDTFGQLGVKATTLCNRGNWCVPAPARTAVNGTAISAGRLYSLVISRGQVLAFGDDNRLLLGLTGASSRTKPTVVPGVTGVTAIAAGEFHSLAIGVLG
jgi:alpha-tubulin suppressor-like RCC1 family protein